MINDTDRVLLARFRDSLSIRPWNALDIASLLALSGDDEIFSAFVILDGTSPECFVNLSLPYWLSLTDSGSHLLVRTDQTIERPGEISKI